MRADKTVILAPKIDEVGLWCSFQDLTASHEYSPAQTRQKALLREAGDLLAAARHDEENWLQRILPGGLRRRRAIDAMLTRAIDLIRLASPDSPPPLENQLRSPELKPIGSIGHSHSSEEQLEEIVNGVVERRSSLINSPPYSERIALPDQTRGALILYNPRENVADGASQTASIGFFDGYDCPPWDLWVEYSDGELISWVPEILFPLAQDGIDANPVECIRWAD